MKIVSYCPNHHSSCVLNDVHLCYKTSLRVRWKSLWKSAKFRSVSSHSEIDISMWGKQQANSCEQHAIRNEQIGHMHNLRLYVQLNIKISFHDIVNVQKHWKWSNNKHPAKPITFTKILPQHSTTDAARTAHTNAWNRLITNRPVAKLFWWCFLLCKRFVSPPKIHLLNTYTLILCTCDASGFLGNLTKRGLCFTTEDGGASANALTSSVI